MTSFEEIVRRIVRDEVRAALDQWAPPLRVVEPTPSTLPRVEPPRMPIERPGDLLSLKAAAVRLGVAEATLRDWRVDRKGPPAVKYGRLVKYRREDLDQWIADRAAGGR